MPLYEYRCKTCGQVVEVLARINDFAPIHCGEEMKRLVSLPAPARFKGGQWFSASCGVEQTPKGYHIASAEEVADVVSAEYKRDEKQLAGEKLLTIMEENDKTMGYAASTVASIEHNPELYKLATED